MANTSGNVCPVSDNLLVTDQAAALTAGDKNERRQPLPFRNQVVGPRRMRLRCLSAVSSRWFVFRALILGGPGSGSIGQRPPLRFAPPRRFDLARALSAPVTAGAVWADRCSWGEPGPRTQFYFPALAQAEETRNGCLNGSPGSAHHRRAGSQMKKPRGQVAGQDAPDEALGNCGRFVRPGLERSNSCFYSVPCDLPEWLLSAVARQRGR